MNAKIASNFALRGYCPLVGIEPVSFDTSAEDKVSVLTQIQATPELSQHIIGGG